MTKDYMTLAADILKHVGGKDNISFATHCVTRLRLTVKDKNRVEAEEINKLASVFGSKWSNNQFQVIIGNEVNDVYEALCQVGDFQRQEGIDENLDHSLSPEKKGIQDLLGTFMETLSSIFAPFIPAIVACGLLQGLLYSIQTLGWIDPNSATYTFFFTCSQAAFYFLPILAAFSAGKRFRCNPYLAATTAAIIMHPTFSAMAGTSIKLFGFLPITYAGYASTVIPAILIVYFQSFVEKACKRVVPKMIDIIVTPLVSVMLSAVVGWMILAPIGNWIGTFVAQGILWLYTSLGPVGGALCGALYPFMLMTGMQVAMSPITVQNLATLGYDFIYPCTASSNAAMAVCALFIFYKSKKEETKSLGLSTGVTALIGVTEPVMFGLIMKYKKALWATVIGGAAGGAIMGAFTVQYLSFGFVPFGTIVLAMTETFPWYLLGVGVAMVVTWIAMSLLKFEE